MAAIAAAPSAGSTSPAPTPVMIVPGSHWLAQAGCTPTTRQNQTMPAAQQIAPGTISAANPARSASFLLAADVIAATSAPGTNVKPATRTE